MLASGSTSNARAPASNGEQHFNGKAHRLRFLLLACVITIMQGVIVLVGVLAVQIVDTARAYVEGEALYSKAQKSAIIRLDSYMRKGLPSDYAAFRANLVIPLGDRKAREALERQPADFAAARLGFEQGHNAPEDTYAMSLAFVALRSWKPFAQAVEDWRIGDDCVARLLALGERIAAKSATGPPDAARNLLRRADIDRIDRQLTTVEIDFSEQMRHIIVIVRQATVALLLLTAASVLVVGLIAVWRIARRGAQSEARAWRLNRELAVARKQAESADRAKSAFLAAMSHELRTPLNAVIGFAELIRDDIHGRRGAEKYREYAMHVHEAGGHLLALINDVLDLSKIEAGKLSLQSETVPVLELLETAADMCSVRARRQGLTLQIELDDADLRIYGDRLRLKQAVINLVTNAIKFSPGGGKVRLVARRLSGGGVALDVVDRGIGMSEEQVATALEPFGQVHNGPDRQFEGTGLGLPISKKLVEMHGGTLNVHSVPEKGTTVTLVFPGRREAAPERVAA